jgi:hypothetical protein
MRRCRQQAGRGGGHSVRYCSGSAQPFPASGIDEESSFISPPAEGQEMSAGPFRIQSAGLASGGFSGHPAPRLFTNKLLWLAVMLLVAAGAWKILSGHAAGRTEGQTVGTNFATTASLQPQPLSDTDPALSAPPFDAAPAAASEEASPLNGLKISSQSWRRGGLGSKALVTFTLRNDNDYAVGDIGLICAFTRADGSPVTERRQTIHDTVKMKSRKTFARVHVGFINVSASRAKCTLLSANRV